MTGYFKLWRELFDKSIWVNSTLEQKVILITILKMANWKEQKWEWKGKPYHCKPGEFITSIEKIANACGTGVSRQNVRTALKRFEKLEFLTNLSTNGYGDGIKVIVLNWEKYQSEANQPPNHLLTICQPTANHLLTTIEEYKNIRKKEYKNNNTTTSTNSNARAREKTEEAEEIKLYGEYSNIFLTKQNYGKLLAMCASQKLLNSILDNFSTNIEIGKEEPYKAELPNAHYLRLKQYYTYRKKNPDKFNNEGERIRPKTKDEAFIKAQERQRQAVKKAFAEIKDNE